MNNQRLGLEPDTDVCAVPSHLSDVALDLFNRASHGHFRRLIVAWHPFSLTLAPLRVCFANRKRKYYNQHKRDSPNIQAFHLHFTLSGLLPCSVYMAAPTHSPWPGATNAVSRASTAPRFR